MINRQIIGKSRHAHLYECKSCAAHLYVFAVLCLSVVLSLLVLESLRLGLDKRVVVTVVCVDAPAVQMQHVRRYCVEKLSVV